jgi:hypothetical protein
MNKPVPVIVVGSLPWFILTFWKPLLVLVVALVLCLAVVLLAARQVLPADPAQQAAVSAQATAWARAATAGTPMPFQR